MGGSPRDSLDGRVSCRSARAAPRRSPARSGVSETDDEADRNRPQKAVAGRELVDRLTTSPALPEMFGYPIQIFLHERTGGEVAKQVVVGMDALMRQVGISRGKLDPSHLESGGEAQT